MVGGPVIGSNPVPLADGGFVSMPVDTVGTFVGETPPVAGVGESVPPIPFVAVGAIVLMPVEVVGAGVSPFGVGEAVRAGASVGGPSSTGDRLGCEVGIGVGLIVGCGVGRGEPPALDGRGGLGNLSCMIRFLLFIIKSGSRSRKLGIGLRIPTRGAPGLLGTLGLDSNGLHGGDV